MSCLHSNCLCRLIPKRSMSKIQISSLYGLEFTQRLWPTNYHCQHLVSALITGATVERLKGLSGKPKKEIVFHTGKNCLLNLFYATSKRSLITMSHHLARLYYFWSMKGLRDFIQSIQIWQYSNQGIFF